METTSKAKDALEFFSLARELRDLIYDELLVPSQSCNICKPLSDPSNYLLTAHNLPTANLALVTRQFNQEYCSRSQAKARIVVEDHYHGVTRVPLFRLPLPAVTAYASHLHLDIYTLAKETCHTGREVCTVKGEVDMHINCVTVLQRALPRLRECTIALHAEKIPNPGEERQALLEHIAELTSVPKLASLEVLKVQFRGDGGLKFDYEQRTGPVMKWKQETGKIEDVSAEGVVGVSSQCINGRT